MQDAIFQQPPVEEFQQPPEALWRPEDDRKLFRSVVDYKKCHNSSLNWRTVQCLYNSMGGAMSDTSILKIQWARITGLMGAGHFNQLTFLDAECVQDLYLVCAVRASASSSRSNSSRSVRSRGYKSLFKQPVAGDIARGYDEQVLGMLASNTDAIAEPRELGMINKEQEDFAIARYANVNRLDTMCEFSILSSPPQRALCIGQMMRLPVFQPNPGRNGGR
jgi:hypothetical protein